MKFRTIIAALVVAFPLVVLAEVVASTTDIVATSTESVQSIEVPVEESEEMASVEAEESSPEAVKESSVTMFSLSVGTSTDISDIPNLETTYRQEHGRYLQVLIGNELPAYESGTVEEKFGTTIPDNVWIDVYDSPAGKGYQIKWMEDGAEHSIGFGPEGDERTYSLAGAETLTATSTEE